MYRYKNRNSTINVLDKLADRIKLFTSIFMDWVPVILIYTTPIPPSYFLYQRTQSLLASVFVYVVYIILQLLLISSIKSTLGRKGRKRSVSPLSNCRIYTLRYSESKDVFYVGQTTQELEARCKQHSHKKFKNIDFYIELLEGGVHLLKLDEREVYWIAALSKKWDLKNETVGGSSLYKRTNLAILKGNNYEKE